jgi:hypothetical protein
MLGAFARFTPIKERTTLLTKVVGASTTWTVTPEREGTADLAAARR